VFDGKHSANLRTISDYCTVGLPAARRRANGRVAFLAAENVMRAGDTRGRIRARDRMYTLYYSPGTASLAVHWLLLDLGEPVRLMKVDFDTKAQHSPEFLALNPNGHVPVLVVDGVPRRECAALLTLLAERHPDAHLMPKPGDAERPEFLQTMVYFANTLQPAFRAWFYADEIAGPANSEAVKEHARGRIEKAWGQIDDLLADGRTHLAGSRLSILDFYGTMLMRWSRNMPKPATRWPHLAAYIARMKQMPSLKLVHEREGLTDWIDG
jgi:glutathione S-transferase